MTFLSNSFHAIPQASPDQTRPSQHKDSGSASVVETAGKLAASGKTHTMPVEAESPRFSTSHSSSMPSHQRSASGSTKNSDSFLQPQAVGDNDEFQMVPNNLKWLAAATTTGSSKHSRSTAEVSRSNDRTQSLTDFQTAFRSPPTITSQSQQSPSLSHTFSFPQNGSSSRPSSGQPLHHQQHHQQQQQQQQQQQGKSGILPDASEMEVVHIKTEEEDEVFSIRLQCQQGGSEAGKNSFLCITQYGHHAYQHWGKQESILVSFVHVYHQHQMANTRESYSFVTFLEFASLPRNSGSVFGGTVADVDCERLILWVKEMKRG